MNHLTRRGGVWWARLVVPERLRATAGRREFVQSCRTHEIQVAKLVAAVLVADWRRQLLALESVAMSLDVLKIVDSAPAFATGGFMHLGEASSRSGIPQADLLRVAAAGRLGLYYNLNRVQGYLVPVTALEPVAAEFGPARAETWRSIGVVVPSPAQMPGGAVEYMASDDLRVSDSADVARAVLVDGFGSVEIVLFDAPGRDGWVFVPNDVVRCDVARLEVSAVEVDRLRGAMAARVSASTLEAARTEQAARVMGRPGPSGKWSEKLFSWAVDQYCTLPDGLRRTLASDHEVRHRRAGMLIFGEFMGDLPLGQIDAEKLREFRDGPLKTFPANVNRLPGELRRATMMETIKALKADGRDWPLMSADMQAERMSWLFRFFRWLCESEGRYMRENISAGLTTTPAVARKDRKDAKRETGQDDQDEEGRRPFADGELVRIFSQAHYKTGGGHHVTKGNEGWSPFEYWLPLMSLYCGIRMSEATQLHLSDVVQIGGVWCLDINEKTADKSLKTEEASSRRIPLHPELERLGFVRWCDRLRQEGYRRVFPELSYTNTPARYSKAAIRAMSSMLGNTLGAERDGTIVFHNFRKNANDAIARAPLEGVADPGLLQFIRYRVIGHKLPKDVNAAHYTSTTVEEMARLVNQVNYDCLPEIKAFDLEDGLRWVRRAPSKKPGWRRGLKEDMGPLNSM